MQSPPDILTKPKKVIYDLEDFPLKKNEGGLYAILPYEKLVKNNKALFKLIRL